MCYLMRMPFAIPLLSFVICASLQNVHLADATKLRRGGVKQTDEIRDVSSSTKDKASSETRSLMSFSTLTQAEIFAMKKTPPASLTSSKCGMFRKQNPLCARSEEGEENASKPPSVPLFAPPTAAPTTSLPTPSPLPTTEDPTTQPSTEPSTRPSTLSPTRLQDLPLNCIQTVEGSELSILSNDRASYRRGDVHCLKLDDGDEVHFGYTWWNTFGLFRNGESVWTIPDEITADFHRWSFQNDGNLVLRRTDNNSIWTSKSSGLGGSRLKFSKDRVWIETNSASTLWFQPPYAEPSSSSSPSPAPTTEHPTDQPSLMPSIYPSPEPTGRPTIQPSAEPSTYPTLQPTADPTKIPSAEPSPQPSVTPFPSPFPTRLQDRAYICKQTVEGSQLSIPANGAVYRRGDAHCLKLEGGEVVYFGYTLKNSFGLFRNGESLWTLPDAVVASVDEWSFQNDGNLVLRRSDNKSIWTSQTNGKGASRLKISQDQVWIESSSGSALWSQPPQMVKPFTDEYPDPNGTLQYYAYYYPWYLRNDWSRHGYQDEPLLGKYGTGEVGVAEQHIQWALQTGITSWVISYWGPNHLTMRHFKEGMLNAPSINKIKFCMLYESVVLDGRGSWRDGSKEEALYQHLKVIRDEFFNHPSYLKINGRPVIIFYITRSRMMYHDGFDGPSVLANMRRRLGSDIYFIADEPFFDWNNKSPDGNENAFKNGKQVFDAYTTYNMFVDSKVRDGETATAYQLREGMPIWKRWSEKVPFFPNVMPQYYDFRGHKPLLGNSADFMIQLREVACLPRTNFNGAPHIMFITSFNEWWEGTQIEPDDGSKGNWNNYGFQFMETLATFKKEVDSVGPYWCDEVKTEEDSNGKRD